MDSASRYVGSPERPAWSNDFPQRDTRWNWLIPGFGWSFAAMFFGFTVVGGSPSYIVTNVLAGLAFSFVALYYTMKAIEHRRPNSIRIDNGGRSVVDTLFLHEFGGVIGVGMTLIGVAFFVMWYWDPYSDLPYQTEISTARQSMMIYWSLIAVPTGVLMLASRPWRRRLVFSPDGLGYRRFGPTVFIPWNTIDSITPAEDRLLQSVAIRARPPAQLPGLERKRLPDGSTRAKLAIYGMSVDPSTIVYVIRRLTAEPDTRRLLSGEHPEDLFTGPSWESRVRMEPGQTWTPDTTAC
jgi:hypothetical protein